MNPSRDDEPLQWRCGCDWLIVNVGVSIGGVEVKSSFRQYCNGFVDWAQYIEMPSLPLPSDPRQLPDTILTVYKGSPTSHTSVAFKRFNTVELLPKFLKSESVWHELTLDQSHKSVSTLGMWRRLLGFYPCFDWEPHTTWERLIDEKHICSFPCLRWISFMKSDLTWIESLNDKCKAWKPNVSECRKIMHQLS